MKKYFFDLKWYGLKLSDVQEPGYGRVEIETDNPAELERSTTGQRLLHLHGRGHDLPDWTVEFLKEAQAEAEEEKDND